MRSHPGGTSATRRILSDGRYHFQDGPIDLIIGADGRKAILNKCIEDCWRRFSGVLPALMQDLHVLKQEVAREVGEPILACSVSQAMWRACARHDVAERLTPMAAVAGSVADDLITCFHQEGIARAFINNGGDIAFHLALDAQYVIGLHADPTRLADPAALAARAASLLVSGTSPIRGVATSGWRGRSFSFGIADAVTILAKSAAIADAAATVVGNAVNVEAPCIERKAADTLKDNADLGSRLVTTQVGKLTPVEVDAALQAGCERAKRLMDQNIIFGAVIQLQGSTRHVGNVVFDSLTDQKTVTSLMR